MLFPSVSVHIFSTDKTKRSTSLWNSTKENDNLLTHRWRKRDGRKSDVHASWGKLSDLTEDVNMITNLGSCQTHCQIIFWKHKKLCHVFYKIFIHSEEIVIFPKTESLHKQLPPHRFQSPNWSTLAMLSFCRLIRRPLLTWVLMQRCILRHCRTDWVYRTTMTMGFHSCTFVPTEKVRLVRVMSHTHDEMHRSAK